MDTTNTGVAIIAFVNHSKINDTAQCIILALGLNQKSVMEGML